MKNRNRLCAKYVCMYNIHITLRLLCSKRERSPITNQWKIIWASSKKGKWCYGSFWQPFWSWEYESPKETYCKSKKNKQLYKSVRDSPGFFCRLQIHSLMEVHQQQKMNALSTNWVVSTFILILKWIWYCILRYRRWYIVDPKDGIFECESSDLWVGVVQQTETHWKKNPEE